MSATSTGKWDINPGLRDSCLIHSSGIKNMPLSLIVPARQKYETAPWNMKFGPMFQLWRNNWQGITPKPNTAK